ncbi:MAG: hypothetical protein HYZ75_08825 [Elusimicrobia bacterium]|nr:hypothetical protein [Elusimicrobiota bacterium]
MILRPLALLVLACGAEAAGVVAPPLPRFPAAGAGWTAALRGAGLAQASPRSLAPLVSALSAQGLSAAQYRALAPDRQALLRDEGVALLSAQAAAAVAPLLEAARADGTGDLEPLRRELRYLEGTLAPYLSPALAAEAVEARRDVERRSAARGRALIARAKAAAAAWEPPAVGNLRPESRAWSLPDGGPLLGRALRPQGYVFGGRRYVDLMNPAAVRLGGRDFIWVRAVRAGYGTRVGPHGEVSTSDYFSDTLLFELRPRRAPRFIERALESTPERLLEDPRLSRLKTRGRGERLYLGVTDHSPHGAMSEKSSRNAFIPVVVDKDGVPRLARDEGGAPKLIALSPLPVQGPDGAFSIVDAKNGILVADNAGRARMLARHRYAVGDPRLPAGFKPADYAEQSFPLSRSELETGPDWGKLMAELDANETLRAETGKGLGPGAPPVRLRRRGNILYVSEGYGRPWVRAGRLPKAASSVLKEGETAFLSFDHAIRLLTVGGKRKRVYTVAVKLRDASLKRVLATYADAVQPLRPYETENPGIPDLWHVYPTGRMINADGTVDTFEGAADSNVVRRRWDLARLLSEDGWAR